MRGESDDGTDRGAPRIEDQHKALLEICRTTSKLEKQAGENGLAMLAYLLGMVSHEAFDQLERKNRQDSKTRGAA